MKIIVKHRNILIFLFVFSLGIITCFGYVKGHYSIDDYNIMNIGYEDYSVMNNLKEGRVTMYLIDQIALLFNMDYKLFIILTVVLAIFISSITIVLYYNEILKLVGKFEKKEKILLLVICYSTFFNFMYLENLYFVEAIVMALALLLYFISAKFLIQHKKILLAIIMAIAANFCYNGIQCYYITLVFILSLLKEKDNYKKIFLNTLIAGGIIVLAVGINLIQIRITCNIFNIENSRMSSISNIFINLLTVISYIPKMIINTSQLFPKYLYLVCISICFLWSIFFAKHNKNNKIIINELLTIIVSIMSCFCISVFSLSSFGNGRILFGMGMTVGLMLQLNLIESRNSKSKILNNFLSIVIVIYFILNILNYMYIIDLHCKIEEYEKKEIMELEQYIEKYEQENNIKVDKFCMVYTENKRNTDTFNITNIRNEVTRRGLVCYFSCDGIINYYTGRKLERVELNKEIFNIYSKLKDTDQKYLFINNILICPIYY